MSKPEKHTNLYVKSFFAASVPVAMEQARRELGDDEPVVSTGEARPGEILDVVADTSRAAAKLDWRPRTSLADGIAAVVAAERAARG